MKLTDLIFRYVPFTVSRFYLTCLGKLYYLLNRQEKVLICETVRQVLRGRINGAGLQRKIDGIFRGIFDHYHEKLFAGYSSFPEVLEIFRNRVRFQGLEELREALGAGRGVILVTGHFGALELLPGTLAIKGFPTSMICRFQTTRLREAQGRRAGRLNLDLIDAANGKSFFAAMKALKAGRILVTECDEFEAWHPDTRQETRFLNHRLSLDRTLDVLHRRSGAPVITALVHRQGQKQYTCHLTTLGRDAAPVNLPISEQCLRVLENAVHTDPEQWYQWKNFAKMIKTRAGVEHDHPKTGNLAPAINFSLPDQA